MNFFCPPRWRGGDRSDPAGAGTGRGDHRPDRRGGDALEYDGLALETGPLDGEGLSPVSALPRAAEAARSGYMAECALERTGDSELLRVRCADPEDPPGPGGRPPCGLTGDPCPGAGGDQRGRIPGHPVPVERLYPKDKRGSISVYGYHKDENLGGDRPVRPGA